MKFQMFEQQMQNMQEQLQAVEQNMAELQSLKIGVEDLRGGKDKEILAHLGKGFFARAKLVSEDFLVDIGDKNFVKKDVDGAKKLMDKQISKMESLKEEIANAQGGIQKELENLLKEVQGSENSCDCGDEGCGC